MWADPVNTKNIRDTIYHMNLFSIWRLVALEA